MKPKTTSKCAGLFILLVSTTLVAEEEMQFAFVPISPAPFFLIAASGALTAADDLGVEVKVVRPGEASLAAQSRELESLVAAKIDGIAISSANPADHGTQLSRISEKTKLVTFDIDVPKSGRHCFVGVDSYAAGRLAGKLVREAIPGGGEVAVFVGRIQLRAARERYQGLVDELLDRPGSKRGDDNPSKLVVGPKYRVLPVSNDEFDQQRAHDNANATVAKHPDLKCMVGLLAYNAPACWRALKRADKTGAIKIVSFDGDHVTLEGIRAGDIYATVIQDAFRMGYESVRVLSELARGERPMLPDDGWLKIEPRPIRQRNIAMYMEMRKSQERGVSLSNRRTHGRHPERR